MIGLGSNRLSVCRRGGMVVTQAGRGGMEWLAGGRGVSPYSAQATAALLAQFPTQWPTIRDYGFAHPEIVGYMNAYAPEDAKIAYSLVEGIGTRWIQGDGLSWINTGYIPTKDTQVNMKVIFPNNVAYDGSNAVNGVRYPDQNESRFYAATFASGGRFRAVLGGSELNSTIQYSVVYDTIFNEYGTHKSYINGQSIGTHNANAYIQATAPFYISTANVGTGVNWNGRFKFAQVELIESASIRNFIPYKHPTQGNGMLDLVNLVFYQNAGSGSFTISETPAS